MKAGEKGEEEKDDEKSRKFICEKGDSLVGIDAAAPAAAASLSILGLKTTDLYF